MQYLQELTGATTDGHPIAEKMRKIVNGLKKRARDRGKPQVRARYDHPDGGSTTKASDSATPSTRATPSLLSLTPQDTDAWVQFSDDQRQIYHYSMLTGARSATFPKLPPGAVVPCVLPFRTLEASAQVTVASI